VESVESSEPVPLMQFNPPGWTEGWSIPVQNAELAEQLERYADLLSYVPPETGAY